MNSRLSGICIGERSKFIDNTLQGVCPVCGRLPSELESPFLFLKLKNLPRATGITLSALVDAHFSESTETMDMRCGNCCKNLNHIGPCPEVGICKNRKTVEKCKLTQYPVYLFIQLVRNIGNAPKVTTFVKIENEIVFPQDQTYEVIATLDHIGSSPSNGHYVTYLKQESGQWKFFDDVSK